MRSTIGRRASPQQQEALPVVVQGVVCAHGCPYFNARQLPHSQRIIITSPFVHRML